MPYLIRKVEEEYCVYKEAEDGEPTGESLGCHATREEADAQLRALYANTEDEETKAEFSSITYNGVTVQASAQRASTRDDKKYERTVRYDGKEKVVHYGDPNMEIRRDNDEARENFNSRHSCSEKTDPFSPGFWSCYGWKKPTKSEDEDMLFIPGLARFKTYKSSDGTEGVVEAPGILFDPVGKNKDLDKEYFTGETYFGQSSGDGVDATLNHRMPIVTKSAEANDILKQYAKYRFKNPVRSFKENAALVGRHVLDLRDEFEAWVFSMAEKGAFSWSTATAPHMADKEPDGKITSWPIIEWAYTPTPAQPLNPRISPLKSISDVVVENITVKNNSEEDEPVVQKDCGCGGAPEDTKAISSAEETTESNDTGAEDARLRMKREILAEQIEIQQFELTLIGER